MAGLLQQLIQGLDPQRLEKTLPEQQATQPDQAATASGALVSMLVRGMAEKSKTKEGSSGLWDLITKQAQQGNLPQSDPGATSGPVVRDLPPEVTDEILQGIFGDKAKNVEHRMGKVITLDPATTKKLMGQVLPTLLGGLFGKAKSADTPDPEALPDVLSQARNELDKHQSKSGGLFDTLLDKDHDGDVDLSDLAGLAGMFKR